MTTKEELYRFCENYVESRLSRIQDGITRIQESLGSETKSSAGDKHETGRAMLQLEREKLGQQLAEAEKMSQVLLKVPLKASTNHITLGSWVKTSKAEYFLAVSAGEFKGTGSPIFCISMATPIGQLLLGRSVGDEVVFNGLAIQILNIL